MLRRAVLTVTPAPRDRIPTWHSKPATGDKFHKPTAEEQAAKFKALEQQAELSWAEEGDDVPGLKVITLKHMFAPEEVAGRCKHLTMLPRLLCVRFLAAFCF